MTLFAKQNEFIPLTFAAMLREIEARISLASWIFVILPTTRVRREELARTQRQTKVVSHAASKWTRAICIQ